MNKIQWVTKLKLRSKRKKPVKTTTLWARIKGYLSNAWSFIKKHTWTVLKWTPTGVKYLTMMLAKGISRSISIILTSQITMLKTIVSLTVGPSLTFSGAAITLLGVWEITIRSLVEKDSPLLQLTPSHLGPLLYQALQVIGQTLEYIVSVIVDGIGRLFKKLGNTFRNMIEWLLGAPAVSNFSEVYTEAREEVLGRLTSEYGRSLAKATFDDKSLMSSALQYYEDERPSREMMITFLETQVKNRLPDTAKTTRLIEDTLKIDKIAAAVKIFTEAVSAVSTSNNRQPEGIDSFIDIGPSAIELYN